MRAVVLDERVRVQEQARELLVEVPVKPLGRRAHLVAHVLGQLAEVVRFVPDHAEQIARLVALVRAVLAQVLEQRRGQLPRPRRLDDADSPRRARAPAAPLADPGSGSRERAPLELAQQKRAARLAVLHLDAVRDVAQELELRGVRPPERVPERLRGGRAICGVGLRQGAHEVRGFPRHALQLFELGIDASGDVRVAFVARAEGVAAARQAVVRQAAQAERVHGAALPPASQALGREPARGPAAVGVARRARRSVGPGRRNRPRLEAGALRRVQLLSEAHVRELASPPRRHQHVLRLQVAVHDAHRVQRVDPRERVAHQTQPLGGGPARRAVHERERRVVRGIGASEILSRASSRYERRQRALAPLERDVDEVVVLLHGETPQDVGVLVGRDERGELGARELVEVREQALDGDRAPVQRALEHHRAARAVAEHRRSDFQAPDSRHAANARMRRGSVHARFVVVHAFVFTRARRRLFFRRRKKRRLFRLGSDARASAAASLLPPRAPLLLAGENARVLRDGVLDGVLDVFRRHRRAPAPPRGDDHRRAHPQTRGGGERDGRRGGQGSAATSLVFVPEVRERVAVSQEARRVPPQRAVQERPAARGERRRGEPLRHARPVVLRRPRRHRDRRPRLAETRAQQSDQPSVLVTLVRSLVRRRFSALAVRREARAGERVQTAGVRADENLRPAAVAPPRDYPRAESLKRGKRRRRERPGPSRRLSGTR